MRFPAKLAIVFGGLMAVACSILVDTSGLSGGAADASAPSAAGDGKAPPPGTDDGSTPPGKDAGGEAGPTPPVGCAGSTDFLCADFDDGALDKGWAEMRASSGATVGFGDSFVSPPRSFRATTPNSAGGEKEARLVATVPSLSPKRVVVSLQMKLCEASANTFEIVKLEEATNGGGIKLLHSGQGARVEIDLDSQPGNSKSLSIPLPAGIWAHLVIDAKYDRTAGSLVITLNDEKVLDAQNIPTFADPITAFMLGPWVDGPALACSAQFDDVHVRFDP